MKKNYRPWIGVTVGALVFLISVSWVLSGKNEANLLYIENQNRRAFTELTESVRKIDIQLSKAVLTREPAVLNQIAHEITANASFAKSSLGQLPLHDISLDKTQKYLSQVGDYTVYLAEKSRNNQPLTEEDTKNMLSLLSYADALALTLEELEESYISRSTTFSDMITLAQKAQAAADSREGDNQFTVLEKEFGDYPHLIYDGAFSDHLDQRNAEFLSNRSTVTKKEAQEAAKNFLGHNRVKSIKCTGESENTVPPTFSFSGKLSDNTDYAIDITKQGGEVLYYLNSKENHNTNLTVEEATEKAVYFLNMLGRGNVTTSYYETGDGFVTLNFCPLNQDVKEYPDLMKVRVSLDNGEILAFEAKGYLMNHREREIPEFVPFEIEQHINPGLKISSVSRTLIPKDDGREIYAYELKGKLNDREYLIYLNAQTGNTEQIFLVEKSENGILTE